MGVGPRLVLDFRDEELIWADLPGLEEAVDLPDRRLITLTVFFELAVLPLVDTVAIRHHCLLLVYIQPANDLRLPWGLRVRLTTYV